MDKMDMKNPIRIYLDTSDYIDFCTKSESRHIKTIKCFLKDKINKKQIEIGYSIVNLFELMRSNNVKNHKDYARIINEVCGENCFPYWSNIGECYKFSYKGHWYEGECFNLKNPSLHKILTDPSKVYEYWYIENNFENPIKNIPLEKFLPTYIKKARITYRNVEGIRPA